MTCMIIFLISKLKYQIIHSNFLSCGLEITKNIQGLSAKVEFAVVSYWDGQ